MSNEFPCFVTDPTRLDPYFLLWFFRQERAWAEVLGLSTGATPTSRNRLKEVESVAMKIPLPPLAEQRRMVGRIEELAAQINDARTLREEATSQTALLCDRGASRIFERLTGVYPLCRLEDVVAIRGGGTPSKADPFYWDGLIPWITPKDMKVREILDSIDHISERATRETAAKVIDPGAVLVVVRGMILAHTFPSAILAVPAAINQHMKALVPGDSLLSDFLCALLWAFNSRFLSLVDKSTHDTRKLETGKLLRSVIPLPPIRSSAVSWPRSIYCRRKLT